jgi:hypothetical protein
VSRLTTYQKASIRDALRKDQPVKRVAVALSIVVLGGCVSSSMPFAVYLNSGEVLRGSASRNFYQGTYYATNGRITCAGSLTSSKPMVRLSATCSNLERGKGEGREDSSGSGQGTITFESGRAASFRFGEAVR